jgi:Sec63 Brl domain
LGIRCQQEPTRYLPSTVASDIPNALRSLLHAACLQLDRRGLTHYEPKSGTLSPTALGRITSHYYLSSGTLAVFVRHLHVNSSLIDLLDMLSRADEFMRLSVRVEEKGELGRLLARVPIPIREPTTAAASAGGEKEEVYAKVNVLLQAHLSGLTSGPQQPLRGVALLADLGFVLQNAGRLCRALFEVTLLRGFPSPAILCHTLCRTLLLQTWSITHPLQQFRHRQWQALSASGRTRLLDSSVPIASFLNDHLMAKLERKEVALSHLRALSPSDLGTLYKLENVQGANQLHRLIHSIPSVIVTQFQIQPCSHDSLTMTLHAHLDPSFQWDSYLHTPTPGGGPPKLSFTLLLCDQDGSSILLYDTVAFYPPADSSAFESTGPTMESTLLDPVSIVKTLHVPIPLKGPRPPVLVLHLLSDDFLHADVTVPFFIKDIVLPSQPESPTPLLDLTPMCLYYEVEKKVGDGHEKGHAEKEKCRSPGEHAQDIIVRGVSLSFSDRLLHQAARFIAIQMALEEGRRQCSLFYRQGLSPNLSTDSMMNLNVNSKTLSKVTLNALQTQLWRPLTQTNASLFVTAPPHEQLGLLQMVLFTLPIDSSNRVIWFVAQDISLLRILQCALTSTSLYSSPTRIHLFDGSDTTHELVTLMNSYLSATHIVLMTPLALDKLTRRSNFSLPSTSDTHLILLDIHQLDASLEAALARIPLTRLTRMIAVGLPCQSVSSLAAFLGISPSTTFQFLHMAPQVHVAIHRLPFRDATELQRYASCTLLWTRHASGSLILKGTSLATAKRQQNLSLSSTALIFETDEARQEVLQNLLRQFHATEAQSLGLYLDTDTEEGKEEDGRIYLLLMDDRPMRSFSQLYLLATPEQACFLFWYGCSTRIFNYFHGLRRTPLIHALYGGGGAAVGGQLGSNTSSASPSLSNIMCLPLESALGQAAMLARHVILPHLIRQPVLAYDALLSMIAQNTFLAHRLLVNPHFYSGGGGAGGHQRTDAFSPADRLSIILSDSLERAVAYLQDTQQLELATENPDEESNETNGAASSADSSHLSKRDVPMVDSGSANPDATSHMALPLSPGSLVEVTEKGLISMYYGVHEETLLMFNLSLRRTTKAKGVLELLAAAIEFDAVPIPTSTLEKKWLFDFYTKRLPYTLTSIQVAIMADIVEPHVKAFILLQLFLLRRLHLFPAWASQFQRYIRPHVMPLLAAIMDLAATHAFLAPALAAIDWMQAFTWQTHPAALPKTAFSSASEASSQTDMAPLFYHQLPSPLIPFLQKQAPSAASIYDILDSPPASFSTPQHADLWQCFVDAFPASLAIRLSVTKLGDTATSQVFNDKMMATSVQDSAATLVLVSPDTPLDAPPPPIHVSSSSQEVLLQFHCQFDNLKDTTLPLYAPDPGKRPNWWAILVHPATKTLLAIKKLSPSQSDLFLSLSLSSDSPLHPAQSRTLDDVPLTLYILTDAFIGIDQEFPVLLRWDE